MLWGVSATPHGKITFRNGVGEQGNFTNYQVLKMAEAAAFDVQIVKSTRAPGGAGAIGTPPVPAVIANAVFARSGARVRKLPLLENLT